MTLAHDVVVIGAGIVGLSAARHLAGAGARVLVVERRRAGEEASAAAAGMLAPQVHAEAEGPFLDLALRARERHLDLLPELEAETGIDLDLSTLGALDVAFSEEEERRLVARVEWQRGHGLPADLLAAEEVRQAEPNVNPAVVRGALFRHDHRVDNVRLARALAKSAVRRGAVLLCGRPVARLVVEGGRVAGVQAGSETLRAPVVVNAAGAWAGLLAGDPAPPPVEPVRGLVVSFDIAPPLLRHVVWSSRGYLVPRSDGRLLAGSTLERAGYDKSVTAAALRSVLDIALEILPELADVRIADAWAGLRPGTPDDLPIVGTGALPGLVHATGLFRNGILLGPLVGECAADVALGRPPSVDLGPWSPARFPR
jgi:glycine oxidase